MSERVWIDRIEGDRAALVCGPEGTELLSLPARLLPEGAREGDALDLELRPVPDDPTRRESQSLMDDLFAD